jgi:Gentisate 1,2-dioxygenase
MSTAEAFEDVHRDAEYFEYSKAADPMAEAHLAGAVSQFPGVALQGRADADRSARPVKGARRRLPGDRPRPARPFRACRARRAAEPQSGGDVAVALCLAGKGTITQGTHEIRVYRRCLRGAARRHTRDRPGGNRHGALLCQRRTAALLPWRRQCKSALRADALSGPGSKREAGGGRARTGRREAQSHLGAARQQALPADPHRTHTMWAMFGIIEPHSFQKPHRHQSIALDLIVDCKKGCYTLVGTELDEKNEIANPVRSTGSPASLS